MATVPLSSEPAGIAANPATNTVYVTNEFFGNSVSVINGQTNTVVATVPRRGPPVRGRDEPTDQYHLRG